MDLKVIGIDCAADYKKIGMSLGKYVDGKIKVVEARVVINNESIANVIHNWIGDDNTVLIAIDAPLGWPTSMGLHLLNHSAGQALSINANNMFRRETDKFIKRQYSKQPLDVGADKIARTAHSAVSIINELREISGNKVELAWTREGIEDIAIIEVYPAITLGCYGITNSGYKKKEQIDVRKEIVAKLNEEVDFCIDTDILKTNDDVLDSVVCLLAAKDFIENNVYYPQDMGLAIKEGWIWARKLR
ncbi:MAG: DUF429 domain-containing protein [Clostridiales bacterium]|jgi:hypothetical protein|nr:DUF429 domain-containing protein [Clostridiales bacterium]